MIERVRWSWTRRAGIAAVALAAVCWRPTIATAGQGVSNGGLEYERRGATSGVPLIFLPALGFSGEVWAAVHKEYEKDHPVFVVSFAGTKGIAPIKQPILTQLVESVHEIIGKEKLDRPVVIGQLFGGHVALRLAAQHPSEVRGVFIIPLLYKRPPKESRTQEAEKIANEYLNMAEEMWEPNMRQQLTDALQKPALVNELMADLMKCDRQMYGRALSELLSDTIEDELPKIQVPVFLLAPVELPIKSRDADVAQMRLGEHARTTVTAMRALYNNISKVETMGLRNAKLFPMVDQPERIVFVLSRFLKKLDQADARWGSTVGEQMLSDKPVEPMAP